MAQIRWASLKITNKKTILPFSLKKPGPSVNLQIKWRFCLWTFKRRASFFFVRFRSFSSSFQSWVLPLELNFLVGFAFIFLVFLSSFFCYVFVRFACWMTVSFGWFLFSLVRVFRAQFCGSILRRDLVAFNAKPYILRFVIRFDFKLLFGCGDFWQS